VTKARTDCLRDIGRTSSPGLNHPHAILGKVVSPRFLGLVAALVLALIGCESGDDDTTGAGAASRTSPEGTAAAQARGVRLKRIGSFDQPSYVTSPPGDRRRLFVVELPGRLRLIRDGRAASRPFLDISADVSEGAERGFLSVAFAPDYARSRRFYVYFTDNTGDIRVQEVRRARGADRADPATRRDILRIEHREFANHNGGQLAFGPDRRLYVGTGDGGGGGDPFENGQNRGTLLGKVLRIDPRADGARPYRIPAGNPFVGRAGMRPEVWAWGLRNPYRFSFDRSTGDLLLSDVGQNAVEEVNFARRGRGAGANYGWSRFEGRRRFSAGDAPGHVPPVLETFHDDGNCSIIGGYVVRDRALAGLHGRYVYGDFCRPQLRSARLSASGSRGDRRTGVSVPQLSSFGEDASRRVYATSLAGPVYRLAPSR
jgi:glucose/arabinose dehydrogenase